MALFERVESRRALGGQVAWFLVWLGVTIFAVFLSPSSAGHGTHQALGLPPCPSVMLFDRPCPGCGLTTSWTAFVHGNWPLAFRAHPLGPPLYLLFSATALGGLVAWQQRLRFRGELPAANRAFTAVMLVFVLFGFARMALTPDFASPHERLMSDLSRS